METGYAELLGKFVGKHVGINGATPMLLVDVQESNNAAICARYMAGNFFFVHKLDSITTFSVEEEEMNAAMPDLKYPKGKVWQ